MKYGPEDIQNLVGTQNWEKALGAMCARRYRAKLKLKKKNKVNCYVVAQYYCIVYICVINVFVVSPCILVSHINNLKKWLFYIYLLTTITRALYQSSEKGMSLLFTCPQLTVEESSLLAAAARMRLLSTAHVMQYFYQIESYHSSLSCGLFQCTLMEL